MPILHAIQDSLGYVPARAIPDIATALNLSTAEVHGVVSFYHYFRTTPGGKHRVQICRAEACQAMGSRLLEAHAIARLDINFQQTTADRCITLEAVYCLGNCACAPAIRIDNRVYGNVSSQKFDSLMQELRTQVIQVL